MNYFKNIFILLLTLWFTIPLPAQEADEYIYTRLDTLLDDMEMNLLNERGLYYCEELLKESNKKSYPEDLREKYNLYAKLQKQSILINLSQNERSILYADSLLEHVKGDDKYSIIYYKAIAYICSGRYQMAINIANELYENSLAIKTETNDGKFLAIQTKANALSCLALANNLCGNTDASLRNYDECIATLTSEPELIEDFEPMILECSMLKMQAAQKLNDKTEALIHIRENEQLLNNYRETYLENETDTISLQIYFFNTYASFADVFCELNKLDSASFYIEKAENLIYEDFIGLPEQSKAIFWDIKIKYLNKTGQFEEALLYSDSALHFYEFVQQKSELVNTQKQKLIALHGANKLSQIYDLAMHRDSLKEILRKEEIDSQLADSRAVMKVSELDADNARLTQQILLLVIASIVGVFAAILGFILMKRKRDKEKQRILSAQKQLLEEEVERQTHELREQKDKIEEQNRDITDSINYAQRIQKSILPDFKDFGKGMIEGSFALFIPCNIVSGDFYWATQSGNKLYYACADCTGHGVPGAFMSMIGTTILNELCKQNPDISPSELLERLHINLLSILQQSGEADSRDGMDIGVLEYDYTTHKAHVSAARRPICFFINDELVEYKAAKRSIGERDYTRETLPFTEAEYDVNPGDTVYIFSDGFPDQFGGPTENGKRLKHGGMVKMLMRLKELPIGLQHEEIEQMYYNWRGDCPQYDDISLLGIRF